MARRDDDEIDELNNGPRSAAPSALPTDAYSVAYRNLCDHPGAIRAASTITLSDFFGRSETWVIETFRHGGSETVFLQRMAAGGAFRLVLPAEVTATIGRQRDRAVTGTRKRAAREAVATRIARGDTLGNPEALAKGRAARSRRKARAK